MSLLRYALVGNLKRFLGNVKDVAKKEGKSSFVVFNKFLLCFARTGCGYSDYMNYKLYKRSWAEIDEYVTIKDQDKFYEIVCPSAYKTAFTVKPNFLKNFKDYISREYFVDGSLDELKGFLERNSEFMIKPYDGNGGHKVEKMSRDEVNNVEEFYAKLINERLFIEECVRQHSEMNRLCPASVNTVRIMSFGYNGRSRIVYAALRIGNGIAAVDNFHQGGMGCSIDFETGVLTGNAVDKDLNEFECHPQTGVKFDGFQIPNWDKVKEIVLSAALVSDKIHFVGWDVAVTEEGATFIEGNRRPGFDLVQVLSERGRKDMMRECLDEINAAEGTNHKI